VGGLYSWRAAAGRWARAPLAWAGLLVLLAAGCATATKAPPQAPPQSYLRVSRATNGVIALEVALRALRPVRGRGPVVGLVAVTHLGTADYYGELQRFLDAQSLVLFEGVGATNQEFELQRDGDFSLQQELAKALALRFQLQAIDYHRQHFRNSDLSLAQLERLFGTAPTNQVATPPGVPPAKSSPQAGGSQEFRALVQTMEGTGLLGGLARLGVAILSASPRLQATMKVALIETLGQLPEDLTNLAGLPAGFQDLFRVLVEERDKAVLRDLRAAFDQRPRLKTVAVFYGAGHMADLEGRLRSALRYRPAEERWLPAFAVDTRERGLSAWELDWIRRLVRQQLEAMRKPPATP
jgi:hypothetical protein